MVLEVAIALVVGALFGTGLHLWLGPEGASATSDAAVAGAVVERSVDGRVEAAAGSVLRIDATGCGAQLQGSATFVRDSSGRELLLTNAHVVRGAESVRALLPGGDRVELSVLGALDGKDAAVLDPEPLRRSGPDPADQGVRVDTGDPVTVAGHPNGELRVQDAAVVDVQRRAGWGSASDVLLVDAQAQGGHSGGAVLDTSGRVVGLIAARDPGTGRVVAYRIDELLSARVGPPPGC